jgi:hypothetical protein
MFSRGELKGKIWRYLGKTATQPGFYTSEKLDDAIEEALNYIAVEMFQAGEGWLTSYTYYDTVANQASLPLDGNVGLIRQVRYYDQTGTYQPLRYFDNSDASSSTTTLPNNGVTQWASTYRLMGNSIVFDPPLGQGGEKYLQLEIVSYPKRLQTDAQIIDAQFDMCALEFLKYKCCSILAGSIEKTIIAWADLEAKWEQKLLTVLNRRVMSSARIRNFE